MIPEWLKSAGALSAVISVIAWFVQRSISAHLERLKHDLAGTLAARARRAEYLQDQITHLYGPLASLFESASRSFATHNRIQEGYHEYFKDRKGSHYSDEMKQVIDVQNHYAGLAVQSNRAAAEILMKQWGWLDPADAPDANKFLTDVERQRVEFEEAKRLPVEFYDLLENSLGAPVVYREALVKQFRDKLNLKRAELSGLSATASGQTRPPSP